MELGYRVLQRYRSAPFGSRTTTWTRRPLAGRHFLCLFSHANSADATHFPLMMASPELLLFYLITSKREREEGIMMIEMGRRYFPDRNAFSRQLASAGLPLFLASLNLNSVSKTNFLKTCLVEEQKSLRNVKQLCI